MKQTTKNILGVAAVVILSSGVAGVTTYKMLNKEKPATFSELFEQNPNNLQLAAYNATDAQPVDLTQAAENSVHAVVHIKSTINAKTTTVDVQDPLVISLEISSEMVMEDVNKDKYNNLPKLALVLV